MVILMSGGIDSSVLAACCIEKWRCRILPCYVRRGAQAEDSERRAVADVARFLRGRYSPFVGPVVEVVSSVPPRYIRNRLDPGRVSREGHPLRNQVLLTIGVQYAVALNHLGRHVRHVAIGSVASDHFAGSQYEDMCLSTLSACSGLGDWEWEVFAPCLSGQLLPGRRWVRKADLIRWAASRGFPFGLMRTCTRRGSRPCGECAECRERKATFRRLAVRDQ